jgi:hypothetical protein
LTDDVLRGSHAEAAAAAVHGRRRR